MADAKGASATVAGTGGQKQRRFARAGVNLQASYERNNSSDRVEATVLNLGGGGLRVASVEDLPREELLTLHFRVPTADHDLMVRGKVVLSFFDASEKRYSHGVAFTQIARVDQNAIVSYVESLEGFEAQDR